MRLTPYSRSANSAQLRVCIYLYKLLDMMHSRISSTLVWLRFYLIYLTLIVSCISLTMVNTISCISNPTTHVPVNIIVATFVGIYPPFSNSHVFLLLLKLIVSTSVSDILTQLYSALGPDSGTPVDPYVVDLDAATDHVGLPENQPVSTWV